MGVKFVIDSASDVSPEEAKALDEEKLHLRLVAVIDTLAYLKNKLCRRAIIDYP